MRYILLTIVVFLGFVSCKKNNGNSAPEIKFKKIASPIFSSDPNALPLLTIEVKDAEGDLGFLENKDTSYIYIKNLTVPPFKIDSFKFPKEINGITKSNFKALVDIDIENKGAPGGGRGVLATNGGARDTLYFEVYVKDFAKNKSNVIKTDDPLLYIH
ncbi:MAG: hypothetical protein HOO89_01360 [Ferruginibacter sp.]|nr:hypothetical protein [Ferruginibacter sp.]